MTVKKLHYQLIAGITPCPAGWLIAPARLANATVIVEELLVLRTLIDVVDYRPKFDAAAINIPLGYPELPEGRYGQREVEARKMVGWPRLVGVRGVPSRAALNAPTRVEALLIEPWLTSDDFRRFRWMREAANTFQPFHQRSFFASNPELSYTLLNDEQSLKTSPFHEDGIIDRMRLLRAKLPGADELLMQPAPAGADRVHVVQAVGLLWTARRAVGRAVNRMPADPGWDSNGMRIDLVR